MRENEILLKEQLNDVVVKFVIYKPMIAASAKAGQFVILRGAENGERIPVTLVDWDAKKGTITVIIQSIGKSTFMFNSFKQGDLFLNILGPLGTPIDVHNYGTVTVVGGGVGIAEVYPIAKALKAAGNKVIAILGARTKNLVILEEEMKGVCDIVLPCTDDGTYGQKGMVTDVLKGIVTAGEKINAGFVIGPIPMMKFTSLLMVELGIEPYASLNPIMLDGTGMCGCCRVTVDGNVRFACVDGPMFPARTIDFNELIRRTSEYKGEEKRAVEEYEKNHKCKIGLH